MGHLISAHDAEKDRLYIRPTRLAGLSLGHRQHRGPARRCPPPSGSLAWADGVTRVSSAHGNHLADPDAGCAQDQRDRGRTTRPRPGPFLAGAAIGRVCSTVTPATNVQSDSPAATANKAP